VIGEVDGETARRHALLSWTEGAWIEERPDCDGGKSEKKNSLKGGDLRLKEVPRATFENTDRERKKGNLEEMERIDSKHRREVT